MKAARRCANCRRPLGDYSRSVGLRRVCGAACQRTLGEKLLDAATPRKLRKPLPRANRNRLRRLRADQFGGKYADVVRASGCVVDLASLLSYRLPAGCDGRIHAAHVKSRGAGGKAMDLVGLCAKHHAEQHRMGIKIFQAFYSVDLAAAAAALWLEFRYFATIVEGRR